MIMVILGVLVGGMVVAMYLPIFKLGAVDLTHAPRHRDEIAEDAAPCAAFSHR